MIKRFFISSMLLLSFTIWGQNNYTYNAKLLKQLEDSRYLRLTMKPDLVDDTVGLPSLEEYNAQVKNGIPLSKTHYLRRFPVAYQFRGFHAIIMGKAKAAFILSAMLNDKELKNLATRQLEYIIGYNPYAMSTIYGDGYDFPPLYGAYAGDVVGAVPVGIETFENDDEPYFPMQNNCTYKEIWMHTTARVMWLVAELFKD